MMAVKFVIGLLIAFFLVTFAAKNQQEVIVSYYLGYSFDVKLWVAILASFAMGAVITFIAAGLSMLKQQSRIWSLNRKVLKVEKELDDLKQKPLPDEPSVYPALESGARLITPPVKEVKTLPETTAASNI